MLGSASSFDSRSLMVISGAARGETGHRRGRLAGARRRNPRPVSTLGPLPVVWGQRVFDAGVSSSAGVFADALTWNRIHIPAAPCPGTPQKIRYSPAGCAVNRIVSV